MGSGYKNGTQRICANKKLRNVCDTPEPRRNLQEDRPLPAPSFFFHPDCHCRLRSCTESALRLVGYTTGRELHPALKSFDSIVWWNFSGCALQVLETTPASTAKRKAPNTRFRARRRRAKPLAQQKTPERTFIPEQSSTRKRIHSSLRVQSSFIQTILSASESHRIMPCGSWAIPPVGNRTLP